MNTSSLSGGDPHAASGRYPQRPAPRLRSPLIFAFQGSAGAFGDCLLGQLLSVGGDGIFLDDGVVLVVQLENIRRYSHAHGVTLAPVTVDYDPHGILLEKGIPLLSPP
jgi:hypothetical protein